ncbi:MAG TPA: hypothetical protein VKA50_08490 [Gammaproteobacteria bacterium]|nr:hypothetical protein [Gammaproteobacteria bacterium]
MFKERLKAFSIHLSISLTIFAVLLYLILVHWYPQPFFAADGGWQGIRIVFGVDVVLGPLLTFIVYRKGKPGLKFDLTMIALVQLTALTWGVHITYSERPVLITYSQFGFYTVTADQLEKTGLTIGDLKRFEQGSVLPMAYVDVPTDPDKREALFVSSLRSGHPVYLMSKLYRPLDAQNREKIRAEPIDVRANVKSDRRAWRELQRFLAKRDAPLDRYIYLPLSCRYRNLVAIVDPKSIDIVGAVTLSHAHLQFKRVKPHKKTERPKSTAS